MNPLDETLRKFIVDSFLFGQGGDTLGDDDSFLEKGIIDSTGVLELVAFIEGQYGIKIADEELVPANLDSIHNVVKFVEQKLASPKAL